jgi:hypothetical protein
LTSVVSFIAIILPSSLYLAGAGSLDDAKFWTLAATVVWFIATPLWMDRQRPARRHDSTSKTSP